MKLSFIVPMYNAEAYIKQCIDSILVQDIPQNDYEIIVVDDGSTDGSRRIIESFADKVRYFYKENGGQSSARNEGLKQATGQYVCFVDADDFLIKGALGTVLHTAIENNADIITYGMVRGTENELLKLEGVIGSNRVLPICTGTDILANYNYNNGPCWYLLKRETFETLRFQEGHYGEDGMFTMELFMKANRVLQIDRKCYCYVFRPNSTTTSRNEVHLNKMIEDYQFVYHYMQTLIEKYQSRLTPNAVRKCRERSETYIFFLLVRLLRFSKSNKLKETIGKLKQNGIYPIRNIDSKNYPGYKYKILNYILNHYWLLRLGNIICGLKRWTT